MKHLYEINFDLETMLEQVLERLDHAALPDFGEYLKDFGEEVLDIYESEKTDHDY